MKYLVRISEPAKQEIDQVLRYTLLRYGQVQRRKYLLLIREALALIAREPGHPTIRQHPLLHEDARLLHVSKTGRPARHYFLLHMVGSHEIEVTRLLHDGMDLMRHVPPQLRRPLDP